MLESNIRNFCIIAHIDHGKSTLADRLLEITGTVEPRRMRPQYLDQLEIERERGITIKMAPVRMVYHPQMKNVNIKDENGNSRTLHFDFYTLNLIDTPGHSDFSYEVSRALAAVEGAILVVDVTKGIQAQTLSNFRLAKRAGLTLIGAVNKVDLQPERAPAVRKALAELLGTPVDAIHVISGKTGEGVEELLRDVVERVPPPRCEPSREHAGGRALIFDSLYSDHKGILAFIRVFEGMFKGGDTVDLVAGATSFKAKEVGYFTPELKPSEGVGAGETGYVATGFKEPSLVKIGDTLIARRDGQSPENRTAMALPGYKEPSPVVFISFYPDGATKYDDMKKALERLRLTDAALSFEPDANEALGRGMKLGFLGQLHFEIVASRLEREFGLRFVTSFPSIAYRVVEHGASRIVRDAHEFPADPDTVYQQMIRIEILAPSPYMGAVTNLKQTFEIEVLEVNNFGDNVLIASRMPLSELIRDFDDQLKSVSAGFASFSYELDGEAPADVEKLEILIAGDVASALTRIVFRKDAEREGRATVERLKKLLPRMQFAQALQARVRGRIIARETLPALKKDVTGYLYGGDRTRKMKLWKKQKRGKERLKERAEVHLPVEVFREILKK